jgi:hypothetical protein
MLNASAMKAGLPLTTTSLLDYLNKNSTNTLLSTLSGTTENAAQKITYQKMEESGDALEASVAALVSDSEDNIFTQARESGNTSSVKKQAKEFVSDYNDLIKNLTSSTSALDSYYRKILEELSADNADELSSIGISIDKKGYLGLNESKFDAADIDTLEEILGSKSTYMTRVGYVAGRVSAQAESNLESLTTQYSSNGLDYTSYTSSKVSFWG